MTHGAIRAITILLLAAASIRFAAAIAGLPLPLASDEEVMIGGALRMIELRNPIPTLSPLLAETLYYPPLVAWIYAAAIVPVAAAIWISNGFISLADMALALSFSPELYWYAARAVSAAFGVATVAVVFRIGRELGFTMPAALAAAALVAVDPTHLMMSATARHWSATVFFICATILFSFRVLRKGRLADYRWAAVLGSLGFGASYIGGLGLAALAATHMVRAVRMRRFSGLVDRAALETFVIAGTLVAIFALANLPAIERLVGAKAILPVSQPKSLDGFVANAWFFLRAYLWSNPVLAAGGLGSLVAILLFWRERRLVAVCGIAFLLCYAAFLYVFMPQEERYALPQVPILALALAAWIDRVASPRSASVAAAALLAYPAACAIQLAILMIAPDTRLAARRWIETDPVARAGVGIHIPGVWFRNTPDAVAAAAAVDAGALRNRDRQVAALGTRPAPVRLPTPVAYVDLDQVRAEAWHAADSNPLAFLRARGWRYAALAELRDWSAPGWYADIQACGTLVASFENAPDAKYDLDMRRTLILREPAWTWFGRGGFGPPVRIYDLQTASDDAACRARTGQ